MSKNASPFSPAQATTSGSRKTVHNINTAYLRIGDQFEDILSNIPLEDLTVIPDLPEIHPALLAMTTIFQYAERLADQEAVEAVRTRMDWKYALHLPVNFPGFDPICLQEFRVRLCKKRAAQATFKNLFIHLIEAGLLSRKEKELTTLEIVGSVNVLNCLTILIVAMRELLEALAAAEPEWLRSIILPHWYERYSNPRRILDHVMGGSEQEALGQSIGADGVHLLKAISEAETPGLTNLPEVLAMKQVWQDQYEWVEGKLFWRKEVPIM
ncbi:MAG TPA: transposase [Anaerolineales bacterium]|nr:transposase [Anaerolineales bacterium]